MGIVRNQSIKNSLSFYIGMAVGAIIVVFLYPNVFHDHPENLGLLQIIVSWSFIISTFSVLGTPKTLIRFFPKNVNKNQLLSLLLLVSFIGFFLFLLIYFLFKERIFDFFDPNPLLEENFSLVVFLVAFMSFFELLSALSRSLLNATTPIFLREVVLKTIHVCLYILHWPKFGILDFNTFLYLYITTYFIMLMILSYHVLKKSSFSFTLSFNEIETKNIFNFGIYVLVGGSSAMIASKIDMIMIGELIDYKNVAFYTVAFYIGNAIRVPGKAIGSIAAPLLSKAWENNNIKEISNIYTKSSINKLIIGGLIFLGIWLNIDDGLSLLPDKFQGGKYVVLFIGLSQLFNISTGVNGQIIINSKYYRFDLYSNLILCLMTLIFNWIFIPEYGIEGAAFATALSLFLFNIIKMIFVYVKLGIHPFTYKTLYTISLIISVYFLVSYIPLFSDVYLDVIIRSFLILIIFIPIMFLSNISVDMNKAILDVWNRYIKKLIS